jgi:uncharacterized membrane protein
MKKNILVIAFTLFLSTTLTTTYASIDKKALEEKAASMTKEQKEARVIELKQRLEEIKAMDKSQLSRADRKNLRQELRDMNKEAKAIGNGGIYISLAGILLIILILILVL